MPRPPEDEPVDPWAEQGLAELGLARGASVRFRRRDGERWREAIVECRERDGSVGLRDAKGAARAIGVEHIEVRRRGRRGGTVWEPLIDVAAQPEQRRLL